MQGKNATQPNIKQNNIDKKITLIIYSTKGIIANINIKGDFCFVSSLKTLFSSKYGKGIIINNDITDKIKYGENTKTSKGKLGPSVKSPKANGIPNIEHKTPKTDEIL